MELNEVVITRRSIRKFKSEKISNDKILKILEAGNLAPTASNRQPWKFLIVQRSTLDRMRELLNLSFKERLKDIGPEKMHDAIKDLSIPTDKSGNKIEGLNGFYETLGNAPIAVIVYVEKNEDFWIYNNNLCDASAAIQNMLLTAWNEGIGSCWMTGPLKKKEKEIKKFLEIDEDQLIVGIIPFGIPEYIPKCPPKQNVTQKTKWFHI